MLSGTLNIDSNAIAGESMKKDAEDEIDIVGVHWVIEQKDHGRDGSGMTQGRSQIGSFIFEKHCDAASQFLALSAMNGASWPTVTFVARKGSGEDEVKYLTVTMENCVISRFEMKHSGDDTLSNLIKEEVSISFDVIKIMYSKQTESGESEDLEEVSYNAKSGESG